MNIGASEKSASDPKVLINPDQMDNSLIVSPALFKVTKDNIVLQGFVGLVGVALLLAPVTMLTMQQDIPLWFVGSSLVACIGLLLYAAHHIVTTVTLKQWEIDYRGLFGRKTIPIKDIVELSWGGGRGTIILTLRTPAYWFMLSNQTFTKANLDYIAEFVYRGAEATSNHAISRPLRQLNVADIPQKTAADFPQKTAADFERPIARSSHGIHRPFPAGHGGLCI